MLYQGYFSNIDNKKYGVEIKTGTSTTPIEITLGGDDPVIITTSSEGLFSPIKSRSCTIDIYSTEYYLDLYEPTSRGTRVRIFEYEENTSLYPGHIGKVIFFGYLTPVSYSQTYSYGDIITLEAVDAISTCKDFKWSNDGTYKTMKEYIYSIVKGANYPGVLYVPLSYSMYNDNKSLNTNYDDILSKLTVSSANFVEDDEEQTEFQQYDVLQEILKYIGYSLVPFGEDVYLIDYKYISSLNTVKFIGYDLSNPSAASTYKTVNMSPIDISLVNEAPGTPNISIDDIYNKISISDNLYKIEDLAPDILESENHISVTEEIQKMDNPNISALNVVQWTQTESKTFLQWLKGEDATKTILGWDYQTICRLKPETGWKHYYYKTSLSANNRGSVEIDNTDGKGYYDSGLGSMYTSTPMNKYINTQGCLIQHYAHVKNEGKNNLPATVDWTDILTFFINTDKTPSYSIYDAYKFELPVLEYTSSEEINFTPLSGTSWITIKGDLYYQYNGAEDDKKKLSIITGVSGSNNGSKLIIATAPVDKSVDMEEKNYLGLYRSLQNHPDYYGTGFRMWKFKVQVGDKYWNGESWSTTESTFYVNYNNNPDGTNDEYMPAFSWCSCVNNKSFKDKAGVDGYCIPITPSDNVKGILKFTIYTPSIISPDLTEFYKQLYRDIYTAIPWYSGAPIIYCKDFEFGYVYTDSSVWYNANEDVDNNDKVYIGYINDNYVNEFDDIEFKVNTVVKDKPISKSYVMTTNYGYLKNTRHISRTETKEQEYNIIDNYLDHHSDRRVIYECNLHGYYNPFDVFEYDYLDINTLMVLDTQSYSLKYDNNRVKLIQF